MYYNIYYVNYIYPIHYAFIILTVRMSPNKNNENELNSRVIRFVGKKNVKLLKYKIMHILYK